MGRRESPCPGHMPGRVGAPRFSDNHSSCLRNHSPLVFHVSKISFGAFSWKQAHILRTAFPCKILTGSEPRVVSPPDEGRQDPFALGSETQASIMCIMCPWTTVLRSYHLFFLGTEPSGQDRANSKAVCGIAKGLDLSLSSPLQQQSLEKHARPAHQHPGCHLLRSGYKCWVGP